MATVLLTGGRAPATLDLARALWLGGHRVVGVEHLAAPVARTSRAFSAWYRVPAPRPDPQAFVEAVRDVARGEAVDLVVPTCEEVFWIGAAQERIAEVTAVLVPPLDLLRRLHGKGSFQGLLGEIGLPALPTTRVGDAAALAEAVAERRAGGEEVVLKPEYTRFATEVRVRPASLDVPVSPERPWVVQRYVDGRHLCTWSVAHRGRLTAHACYAVDWNAARAAIRFEAEHHPGALDFASTLAARTGLTGQFALDLCDTAEGMFAFECNPRLTSGIHLLRDHPGLPAALLDPDAPLVQPHQPRPTQLAAAMVVYGLPDAARGGRLGAWLRAVLSARDAVAWWRDPLPALAQLAAIAELAWIARRSRRTLTHASTLDIEWNG